MMPSSSCLDQLEKIPALWGYMVRQADQLWQPGNEVTVENVYLLPFNADDGEGAKVDVTNGLPPDFLSPTKFPVGQRWSGTLRLAWGDDGVICWQIMCYHSENLGRQPSWVVCYEENWGM